MAKRTSASSSSSSSAPPASKKVKLVKQTDSTRRELRGKQRTLAASIVSVGGDIEDATKTAFQDKRRENNVLFDEVNYAREAVTDGENLMNIATR